MTDKKRSRPKKGEAPKTEKYERKDGPILVQNGKTREIRVAETHPAALAKKITGELGGKAEATPSGLKCYDKDGRCFLIVSSIGKTKANFYNQRVPLKVAKETHDDLGDWNHTWPKKKAGPAALFGVEKVTKTMIRALMKLHATHAIDRRKKGSTPVKKTTKKAA